MILGISTPAFTLVHVVFSLIALASGFVVIAGLIKGKDSEGWTRVFLSSMVLTDASGYLFPTTRLLPSQILGAISLVALAIAIYTRYSRRLAGRARSVYAISAIFAVYLDAFVAVIQSFQKIGFLKALAPHQTEAPFAVTQIIVLALFVAAGVIAVRSTKGAATRAAGAGV